MDIHPIHLSINILISLGVIVLIITMAMEIWGCLVVIVVAVTGVIFLILMFSWASYIIKIKKQKGQENSLKGFDEYYKQ